MAKKHDLLILSDITDHQVSGQAIKRKAPWISQPIGPDLRALPALAGERISLRDRIAARGLRVDPQQLAEEDVHVLAVVAGIALTPAVADADVQVPIGTELQLAAVVIRELMVGDRQHVPPAGAGGNICVATLVSACISVISPEGQLLEQVPTGDVVTTNICFGGADRKTATITLSGKGHAIEMPWARPGLALSYG